MKSLALLVSGLLAIALLGGPVAMFLSAKLYKVRNIEFNAVLQGSDKPNLESKGLLSKGTKYLIYKSLIATLAALSILANAAFLIEHIPATLRLLSFLALCTGLIAIKRLFFQKSK
jgi:hypothetical protein